MLTFRVSRPDAGQVLDVDSADAVEAIIRSGAPGRIQVDDVSSDPSPSGHTSRRWGTEIKWGDRTFVVEPDPWPER
jgi:hypothetical protein